jgi:hypothetical protein
MSDADALRLRAFYENRAALNELVHAVERLEVPSEPDDDDDEDGPTLDDFRDDLDDFRDDLDAVKALAERAREALLRMNAYDPPMPAKS